MNNLMRKSAILLCAASLFVACDDRGGENPKSVITLNKTTLSLKIGESETLVATLTPEITAPTYTWSSDNEAVATVTDGTVTAIATGEAKILVTIGNGISASCTVTVSPIAVTGISLDKNTLMLITGDVGVLTAAIEPENATDMNIVWSSDKTDVATVTNGSVTAVAAGEAVITATAGEFSTTCAVSVNNVPKIGDYYYSDGTWSDGGLISIEAHGLNPVWNDNKPAPLTEKTVVGIVFQTTPERIAQSEKEKGFTHGYVVAVKNAHPVDKPTVFYTTDYNFASTPQAKIAKTWYTNVNGYNETMKVISDYGENIRLCPAFDITVNSFSLKASETSSGWFLPSTGQLWDMVANLCGHEVAVYMKEWQTSSQNVYNGYNVGNTSYNVIDKFNETISKIPADQKEELFLTHDFYDNCTLWITTCFDPGETACVINLGGSTKPMVELMCEYVDYDGVARPILAF